MSSRDPRHWLDYAARDAAAAHRLLISPPSLAMAAYAVQQSAEKAIKARLVDLDIAYPRYGGRGHDLAALARLIPDSDATKVIFTNISDITPWATVFRYPSEDPATEIQLVAREVEDRLRQVEAAIHLLDKTLPRG